MKLTAVHQRMVALLSDGELHTPTELHGCLFDELSQTSAVRQQLAKLRKVLRPIGQDIRTVLADGKTFYQHVRIVPINSKLVVAR